MLSLAVFRLTNINPAISSLVCLAILDFYDCIVNMVLASSLTKQSQILIVGGGTWGCSTALHVTRRGYTNVTLITKSSRINA